MTTTQNAAATGELHVDAVYDEQQRLALAQGHAQMAGQIAQRLHRWYCWIGVEDLHSYAYLGLALAAKAYQPDRGVPFANFASQKALFLAIDEMRKDGVLKRKRSAQTMRQETPLTMETADPRVPRDRETMEQRDVCAALMKNLDEDDRRLVLMYYGDQMTFREIAEVFDISESAVCLRHKAVLKKLRRLAKTKRIV